MNFCNALYAQEEHEKALHQLELLLDNYRHQPTTPDNSTILSIQPSLPQLLTVASRVLANHEERAETWYTELAQGLDPRDRQLLARFHIHVQEPTSNPLADA